MQTFSQLGPSEVFFIARRDNPCTRLVIITASLVYKIIQSGLIKYELLILFDSYLSEMFSIAFGFSNCRAQLWFTGRLPFRQESFGE